MEGESCWKSGGGRMRFYSWPRVGLADEASSDAIPDAPNGVIHRYISIWSYGHVTSHQLKCREVHEKAITLMPLLVIRDYVKGCGAKVYDTEVFGLSSATPYLKVEILPSCPRKFSLDAAEESGLPAKSFKRI
jgi:hypothetical protein